MRRSGAFGARMSHKVKKEKNSRAQRDGKSPSERLELYPGNESRRASFFSPSASETAAEFRTASLRVRHGKPTVRVKIRGVNTEFIVDSGSDMSLIKPGICHGQVRPSRTTSFGVTGDELGIKGEQDVQFCIANWKYRHTFRVCSLPTNADRIIGIDFLAETSASLDIGQRVLRLRKRAMANSGSSNRRPSRGNTNYDHNTLTVFSETYVKQHKGKQTPKSDFEMKSKARSKPTRGNASCGDAQVATVVRQHGEKARKRKADAPESDRSCK